MWISNAIEEIEPSRRFRRRPRMDLSFFGFGNFGEVISGDVRNIVDSYFDPNLPGSANTTNASWYNALTYIIGPTWTSVSPSARLAALRDARQANRTYMVRYFSPEQVAQLQSKLGVSSDGKLGPGTAKKLSASVPKWNQMTFESVMAALPSRSSTQPGPTAEPTLSPGAPVPESPPLPAAQVPGTTQATMFPGLPGGFKLNLKTGLIFAGAAVIGLAMFAMSKKGS